jgi:crotonobetainyl-CoA:carnitine CoA-transferase CaiB-like acyl-CoA transferase
LADLGADVIKLDPPDVARGRSDWRAFNANKRVADFDPRNDAGRRKLEALLAKADICLLTPATFDCAGLLRASDLRRRYPRLIVVVITPFGRVGPRSAWRASDLEVMAAGAAMALAGEPDGMPLRVSEPQSYSWTGAQAATGALVALYHREATSQVDLVEVSAQAAVVTAIAHAAEAADILQAVGIAAYPVVDVAGLFGDPQLLARHHWRVRRHAEMGDQTYCFPGFDLEGAPGDIVSPAPCLGADNDFVFRELVGLSETEMQSYADKEVFG